MRRALVAAFLVALSVLFGAAPAGAHASLVGSEPAPSASLPESPEQILLDFDEAVDAGTAEIRLLDTEGASIGLGPPTGSPSDATVITASVPELDEGAYVVAWRIVSDDNHPVSGAFPFQVGDAAPIDTSALLASTLEEQQGDPTVEALLTASRLVGYAGMALLIGGYAFVRRIWRGSGSAPLVRRTMLLGWVAAVVGSLGTFLLTGPYTQRGTLGNALSPDVWQDVLAGRSGRAIWVRVIVAGLAGIVVTGLARKPTAAGQAARIAILAALVVTTSIDGHEAAGRWTGLAMVDHAIHITAMSLWLGGLALLAICLVPRAATVGAAPRPVGAAVAEVDTGGEPSRPSHERVAAVRRFSTLAQWCVAALVLTGVFEAWRLLDGVDALFDTTFGRTLVVKLALVAALVALGAWSRRLVRRRERPDLLWRSVVTEVAVALSVLAVTATLVDTNPREVAAVEPFQAMLAEGDVILDLTVTPARAGTNEIHLTFSPPGGSLQQVSEMEVRMTAIGREDLGPVPVELTAAGPNHAIAYGVQVPFGGEWSIEVLATAPDGARLRYATPVDIAG
jgi:copper transport protein